MISLTETNADIQKIVAFENAFDRLLEIITAEGGLNGGIIVQDCLQLTLNLLRYNVSNQVRIVAFSQLNGCNSTINQIGVSIFMHD